MSNSPKVYLIISLVLFAVFLIANHKAHGADLFNDLAMPPIPIATQNPDWTVETPSAKIEYSFEEYYKKWLDKSLVNDFSGYRFKTGISLEPAKDFLFGLKNSYFEKHKWMNSVETKNESFNLDSDAETREIFLRFKRKNSAIEISQEKGNSLYHGFFDLHQDLISALGKNPPLFLDNKYKQIKLHGFSELKRFKLLFGYSSSKPKHSLTAKTPAMHLLLNLDREIEQFAAEVSWERSKRFIPYFRHYSSTDEGNGINIKDNKFKFGHNRTKVKVTTNSLGFAFPLSSAKCFFEYSKTDFDSFMSMETNLITLDPLFLFSTNQVDYDLKFQPNSGWGTRLGGKKKFGRFELAGQYSFLTFKGTSALNSRKFKGLFATRVDKSTLRKTELKLHRMSITTKKDDRFGSWAVNLNLILPLAKSKETNIQAPPPLPPTPPAPLKPKAKESVRGGWQIKVSREFRF